MQEWPKQAVENETGRTNNLLEVKGFLEEKLGPVAGHLWPGILRMADIDTLNLPKGREERENFIQERLTATEANSDVVGSLNQVIKDTVIASDLEVKRLVGKGSAENRRVAAQHVADALRHKKITITPHGLAIVDNLSGS